MAASDYPRIHVTGVGEWRRWLEAHHATERGVWVVLWKAATGRPRMSYEEAIPEALAHGWIDSVNKPVDDERTALLFTPRRPGSGWSRSNKERVAILVKEGRLRPGGRAAIERAKRDGSWSLLDGVERMTVPPDLRRALGAAGLKRFDALTPGKKRAHLLTLVTAKRPETRAKRIAAIVAALR